MIVNNENIKILIYVGFIWYKGMFEGRVFEIVDIYFVGIFKGEKFVIIFLIWWFFINEGSIFLVCLINRWKDMFSFWYFYKIKWFLKFKYGILVYIIGIFFLNVYWFNFGKLKKLILLLFLN